MDENRFRFGVGVLVVSSVGIAIILTFLFGAFPALLSSDYEVTVQFPSAPGVSPNTPVLRDGVRIGQVRDVRLLREGGVDLTLAIGEDYRMSRAYVPRISSGSLITGDAVIEFVQATDEELIRYFDGQAGTPPNGQWEPAEAELLQEEISDGEYITYGRVSGDPMDVFVELEDDIRETLGTIKRTADAIEQASVSVNGLAVDIRDSIGGGQVQLKDIAEKTGVAVDEFRVTMSDIRALVGDPQLRQQLQDSMQRLPLVLDEAERTLEATQQTMQSFERVGAAAERTVLNVEQFTQPLAERGDELVDSVLASLKSLDRTLLQFGEFGDAFNRNDGTLRRLMEDDELYWQIKRVVDNVEGATVRIRPILDDVRVFSDKLARDPRQLGLKGALDHRPSGVGLK